MTVSLKNDQQTVLVVDDNEHQHKLLEVYSRTLENITVSCVSCLGSAIDHLQAARPDLIMLDSRLKPYTDFRETVPQLREAGYVGKIIVVSADVDQPVFQHAKDMGINACVDKQAITLSNYRTLMAQWLA